MYRLATKIYKRADKKALIVKREMWDNMLYIILISISVGTIQGRCEKSHPSIMKDCDGLSKIF